MSAEDKLSATTIDDGKAASRRGRRKANDPIAAGLRRMWADAEQEPVPDDLMALLDQIDAGARGRDGSGESGAS